MLCVYTCLAAYTCRSHKPVVIHRFHKPVCVGSHRRMVRFTRNLLCFFFSNRELSDTATNVLPRDGNKLALPWDGNKLALPRDGI